MRYEQSVQQSAEILRLVLPNFPKHSAAYHPISYALWYEYVSGINPPLKERIDALLAEGRTIDDELAHRLYREMILDSWSAQTLRVNTELEGLVTSFEVTAERARTGAEEFDRQWRNFEAGADSGNAAAQDPSVAGLVRAGLQMRNSVTELRRELQASAEDTRRLKAELRRLHSEVLTDPLTGLVNRRGLDRAFDTIHQEAAEQGAPCSAILVDVDHFKRLNDTFGHLFGDQVLKSVASVLRKRAREEDLVSRFGGEEFLIVLPRTPAAVAQTVAEDIRAVIERSELRSRGNSEAVAKITISAGVTGMRDQDTPANMIARADSAMYRAKNRGRNQVAVMA